MIPAHSPHRPWFLMVTAFFVYWGYASLANAWVTESEPNNNSAQADAIACGDTVYCALLSPFTDVDCFRFTGRIGDSILVTTFSCNGSNTNTLIALYDNADSILAVNDNGGAGEFSMIRYLARYTGEYTLSVLRHPSSADSTYSLFLGCAIPEVGHYDTCGGARIVTGLPYYDEGSTFGATHQCGTPAPDVFYRFRAPVIGDYAFTVCTEEFGARVQLLGRCCGDYLDDADEGCQRGASMIVYGLPAADYFVIVEGTTASQRGSFSLEIEAGLPECLPPERLTLGTVGGLPFLDWEELPGIQYYVVWSAASLTGTYEHLGTSLLSFFTDSTGFVNARRFYRVTSVCQW